jgi:hypothetical protein
MPKVPETTDMTILNKGAFFENHAVTGYGLDMEDTLANKLSLDDYGNTLYATGVNGTHVVNVDGPNMQKVGPVRPDMKSTTVECVRDGCFILQEPNTNNVYLSDASMNTIKTIDGLPEGGKVIEDLHHYRHSLDYGYLLWRSGQDNLSILDATTFECDEVIKQFWTYNQQSSMPVAAVSNVTASRIVATSQAGPDNYVIHYYQDDQFGNIAYARPVAEVILSMYKLTCMEVSYDEQRVYIAGIAVVDGRAGTPIAVACRFDETLEEIAAKRLIDLDYGTPYRMKRMTGTEILVIGCVRHFAILEYIDGQLIQLASLENIHDNEICDFEIRGNYMYSTAFNEPLIKATQFDLPGDGTAMLYNPNSRYSEFYQQRFAYPGLDDLHKVATSVDGARLFTGGRGLHRFDTAGGQLTPIELDTNKGIFSINLRHQLFRVEDNQLWLSANPRTNHQ